MLKSNEIFKKCSLKYSFQCFYHPNRIKRRFEKFSFVPIDSSKAKKPQTLQPDLKDNFSDWT